MKLHEFAIGLAVTAVVFFACAGLSSGAGVSAGPALLIGLAAWACAACWLVAAMKKPAPQRS